MDQMVGSALWVEIFALSLPSLCGVVVGTSLKQARWGVLNDISILNWLGVALVNSKSGFSSWKKEVSDWPGDRWTTNTEARGLTNRRIDRAV